MVREREITANTLRAIPPAKIVQTIAWRETGGNPPRAVGDVDPLTGLARFEGVAMDVEAIVASAPSVADESKRGRRGPSRSDLEQFTSVYLSHYRAGRDSPVKRTMTDLHIGSRATAHRRIDQARSLGLIPPREEHRRSTADAHAATSGASRMATYPRTEVSSRSQGHAPRSSLRVRAAGSTGSGAATYRADSTRKGGAYRRASRTSTASAPRNRRSRRRRRSTIRASSSRQVVSGLRGGSTTG